MHLRLTCSAFSFAWLLGMVGLSCVLVRAVGMELEGDSLSGIGKKMFVGRQD